MNQILRKTRRMSIVLSAVLLWIVCALGQAQPNQQPAIIKGKVLDETGSPLPGTSIMVVGSSRGVVTDFDGYYAIEARQEDELQFSFVGYVELIIKVGNRQSIDVVMKENVAALDEVVVVAMGTQRKASITGAISSIKVSDITMPSRSLTNALAGRMAGAVIVQRTGEIGNDNASFWIRGISTFGENRSPLILVDGVERSMENLAIEEVESVNILKDASATAVYGTRAANGVVLITTRRGLVQKPLIELKVEHFIADLPGLPKFLSGPEYAVLYNEALGREHYSPAFINSSRNGTDPYLCPNVNWYDEIYKKYTNNTSMSLNVTGGGEVARYFVGFSYINENGNLKDDPANDYKSNLSLDRYNYRSNVDISISKTTVLDIEVGGWLMDLYTPGVGFQSIYGSYYTPAQELFYHASLGTPIGNPVRLPIGVNEITGENVIGWGAPPQVGERNPAERLFGSGYNSVFSNQFMGQITLNQDLKSLLEGLKFRFSFSFDAYNQTILRRNKNSNTYMVNGRDADGNLMFSLNDTGTEYLGYASSLASNRAKEMKAQLIYDKLFGSNQQHRVGAMTMYYQRDYVNGNAGTAIQSIPYRRQGIAFRTTYAFKDTYFGEFNLGYNGSENSPKDQRYGLFPAFSGGWLISNEEFWNNNIVNMLKIKGSIGLVGSESLPGGERYAYLSLWGSGLINTGALHQNSTSGIYFGPNTTQYPGTGEIRMGLSNLTWEKGLKKNAGFELSMFKNLFTLEADFFHERRTDILVRRESLPDIAGFPAAPLANIGEMVNRGVDATIRADYPFNNGGVNVYGNFTFARDKIIFRDEAPKNYPYRMRTGHKYNQLFGLYALGYFTDEDDIANHSFQTFGVVRPGDVKYKDINGDGRVTIDDEVPIGFSNLPEINYGFGMQVNWHGFDLGLFFRGQARVTYQLWGAYIPFNQGVGKGNLFVEALDRWTVDNPRQDAQYPRLFDGTSANNWVTSIGSSKNIYNGSFLRLSDIEVGYNFKGEWLEKIYTRGLRVYFILNNAYTFSKWKMWDPETGTGNGQNYPLQRKFNFGIKAKF